eukprot:scaffold154273_cov37-Tisochrysis_lutea.AAC.8
MDRAFKGDPPPQSYDVAIKVHTAEYGIILLTFLFINLFGLELGMACGVLVAMAHFIADYARAPIPSVHSPPQDCPLCSDLPAICCCRGYTERHGGCLALHASLLVIPP